MPASGVYLVALEAGFVAALHDRLALLDKLGADPATTSDPKLAQWIALAKEASNIELTSVAGPKLMAAITAARSEGLRIAEPPTDAGSWQSWLENLGTQANADRLSLKLGPLGGALARAWGLAETIAYLRASAPDLPVLVEAAANAVTATREAWQRLQNGLSMTGRVLVDARRPDLEKWMGRAPAADAVTSKRFPRRGAYAEMRDWRETIDLLLRAFARDLAAPLPAAPTAEASDVEQRLVATILENPDDETALRRFAQLATQRGDERGEVVRLELDFAPGSKESARAKQIIASHPEWTKPLVDLGARDIVFVRGFPRAITIDASTFVENVATLLAAAPIRIVRLRNGAAASMARIAALPQLAHVTGLDLADQGITDAEIAELAQSPHVSNLVFLKLDQNEITDAGVDMLASATRTTLRSLRSLNLQLNKATNPVDQDRYIDETTYESAPTPEGIALEQKYGPLAWLHPYG